MRNNIYEKFLIILVEKNISGNSYTTFYDNANYICRTTHFTYKSKNILI